MGLKYIESDHFKTEILSAYRFKKELVYGDYQYGYILFYQHQNSYEFEEDDGNIEYVWMPDGRVQESYILSDYQFRWLLESLHRVSMSPTYVDAFWKAHRNSDDYSYLDKMTKEEYFYQFNKYYHLTLKQ